MNQNKLRGGDKEEAGGEDRADEPGPIQWREKLREHDHPRAQHSTDARIVGDEPIRRRTCRRRNKAVDCRVRKSCIL